MRHLKRFFGKCLNLFQDLSFAKVKRWIMMTLITMISYIRELWRVLLMLLVCFVVMNFIYFVGFSFGLPPVYGIMVAELAFGAMSSLALCKVYVVGNADHLYEYNPVKDATDAFILAVLGPICMLLVLLGASMDPSPSNNDVMWKVEMLGVLLLFLCNALPVLTIALLLFTIVISFVELPEEHYREDAVFTIFFIPVLFVAMAIAGGVVTFPIVLHLKHIGIL